MVHNKDGDQIASRGAGSNLISVYTVSPEVLINHQLSFLIIHYRFYLSIKGHVS